MCNDPHYQLFRHVHSLYFIDLRLGVIISNSLQFQTESNGNRKKYNKVKQTGIFAPVFAIKCIRVARRLVEIKVVLLILLLLLCLPDIAISFSVLSKCKMCQDVTRGTLTSWVAGELGCMRNSEMVLKAPMKTLRNVTGYQIPSPHMEPACLPRDEKTTLDLGFPCSDLWVCINLKKLGESVHVFI